MAWRAVISLALALIVSQTALSQISPKKKKGPRAVGLLELAPTGKAHLIPVAILIDGEYYDASAYKANPVPMALDSGTVYEAISTGVSQGLFTVAGAVQANHVWLGEGTWQAAGSVPPKKVAAPSKPADEDAGGPPVLRRAGSVPKPTPAPPAETKPPVAEPEKKAEAEPPIPVELSSPEDPDRPMLHRGKPTKSAKTPAQPEPLPKPSAPTPAKAAAPSGIRIIPAISDANVQEPRSFEYKMKPDEEEQFRKKMLAMATDEVTARSKALDSAAAEFPVPARTTRAKTAPKEAPPTFDDVQVRVFDLTSNNEPILVMTATAHPKPGKSGDLPYFVTLVARNNIYGELKKVFSNLTDAQHLDVIPQMQLIDVVDADGDGRGELLFRRASDRGSAYSIYRVIGTQLFPLFEGKI